MAAYAAVISLKQTIDGLQNSPNISPLLRKIVKSAHDQAAYLQQVLEQLNYSSISRRSVERLEAVEGQIRDCAHKLEDVIEFHELNPDEEQVRHEITSFSETVKKIAAAAADDDDAAAAAAAAAAANDDDDDEVSSNIDFGVEMVGQSVEFNTIRKILLDKMRPDDLCFFSFFGEKGSGRTSAMIALYDDLRNGSQQLFDCSARVTIGKKHEVKHVLMRILAQVDNQAAIDYELMLVSIEEDELWKYLHKRLEHRSYMIALDDVWDGQMVECFRRWLPDNGNGSLVLVTTSLLEVVQLTDGICSFVQLESYFVESIWLPIRGFLFGIESINEELEEAGRKIVRNCRGCVIIAAKVLLFLSTSERTVEHWSKIAEDEENPIFMVEDETTEINILKLKIESKDDRVVKMISTIIDNTITLKELKRATLPDRFFSKMQIISLLGMAGIGKSTVARNIFRDKSILHRFDHHVWITLGPNYEMSDILIDILSQIYPDIDKLHMKGNDTVAKELCRQLSSKRCLIVLDDLWSKDPLHHLKNIFPNVKGITLVTTRLAKVARFGECDIVYEMQLLDEEKSWCLLRQKVFVGGPCPPELEKVGRKIAEKCDGLPLLILTVADQLLKIDISQECWNDVASGKQKSVFLNAHRQISKALLPSYQSLPQNLKACFLYVGIFREKYEIPQSMLTNLWIAEKFLEPNLPQMVEAFSTQCLSELVDRSLVIIKLKISNDEIRTCRLHSVFWHLSNSEAMKNNFFHAMNNFDDCSIAKIKSKRRLCIRNSILLGMKDVQNSMTSNTTAHSFICVNPLHQYPVPINFDLKLLRVMKALSIRLYEFPLEVVTLVHLRYLSLTCNGKLPTTLSNLWKLQYLIVKRYRNIKSSEKSWILPVEIWDMKELKHLEVMGGCLPNNNRSTGLLKLSTLLGVSVQSCRKKVLRWIPNLKILCIHIELAPSAERNPFRYLNHISRLRRLESLKCIVVNPWMRREVVLPPAPISMFPRSLKRLSLSGTGYSWEHMDIIGSLENLEVLKLKHYAFRGERWEMGRLCRFNNLKSLLIEDTDLVKWKCKSVIAMKLECLYLKHCYKLREIPIAFYFDRRVKISVVDCNRASASWAEEISLALVACEARIIQSWLAAR